jgi:hypothetical protein
MSPCCFVCKWSKKNTTRPIDPKNNNPLIEPLECLQQGFAVWLPSAHVCANLGDPSAESGSRLSAFVEQAGLESGSLYAWLQFSYAAPEAPTSLLYHHECVRLASFEEFSAWTLLEKQQAYAQKRKQREQELLRHLPGSGARSN